MIEAIDILIYSEFMSIDTHQESNPTHSHDNEDAAVKLAKTGNLALGVVGGVVGLAVGSEALVADSVHNIGDFYAHHEHHRTVQSERNCEDAEHQAKSRKKAAIVIGALAVAVSVYSAHEFYSELYEHGECSLNTIALCTEMASVALNGLVFYKNRRISHKLAGHNHSDKHNTIDLLGSSAAAAGIALNPLLPGIEGIVGIGIGLVTLNFSKNLYTGRVDEHGH
jgi:divalent metal cation (Fe/Co/Zn/Cd) transporter